MNDDLVLIYMWPDGTWCYPEELSEMTHLGDNFSEKLVTVEQIERAVHGDGA